ncbi:methyltransferase domain-containing protein [Geomesophilobacter sediminis]|uniref:Chemotaxis protein CheR n=1 Tax=Geomesophilobacter sediminis TaxID=2798584 RepID=A0A8J7LWG4_9BACT|nr:chemotaxis protein CheR [Geomesophilobacter sediminis]MBJ6725755.1 chemotaxis protein CheR [Geomesophilobacter sediminis]
MRLSFAPTFDAAVVQERLDQLLVPESILGPWIGRRLDRLDQDFRSYAASYPLPLWAPGLVLTHEMRSLTEATFPYESVRRVVMQLLRLSCRFPLAVPPCVLDGAATWLDLLVRAEPLFPAANPVEVLREAALDFGSRARLIFSLYLPRHYGGGFDRYPRQYGWIREWLSSRKRRAGRVQVLDAACGSGEGTYGLGELLVRQGYDGASAVHGSTLEPFELFAAAHAYFPHDPCRQNGYRERVAPLLEAGKPELQFYLDDLSMGKGGGGYDLIVCNGLLGGPMLHRPEQLREAVSVLAGRLTPCGILLAADRFHEGWKQAVPPEALQAIFKDNALTPFAVPEGVAGAMRNEH